MKAIAPQTEIQGDAFADGPRVLRVDAIIIHPRAAADDRKVVGHNLQRGAVVEAELVIATRLVLSINGELLQLDLVADLHRVLATEYAAGKQRDAASGLTVPS